jgi:hypothetical protein
LLPEMEFLLHNLLVLALLPEQVLLLEFLL